MMPGIPWDKVTAFHMDEYLGLPHESPQGFGTFLRKHLFDAVPLGRVELLNGTAADPESECRRYAEALQEAPLDIICMGIGENGHIAFNDPPVADFHDPLVVKVVELDAACRRQQVNDGCFPSVADVPRQALTLTVPALLSGKSAFVVVPGMQKARAVFDAVIGPLHRSCPASILRRHPSVRLFLDTASATLLGWS
jgi:glucosamine-6-phosphate deaminase